jgi:undecaprenyl-diphosphatase
VKVTPHPTAGSFSSTSLSQAATAPRKGEARGSAAPVLDARGKPAWLPAHPVGVFALGVAAAYALIAGLSIVLGLLLTHVILQSHGIATADNGFVRMLARHRTATWTEASLIGSIVAGGVVLPIVAGVGAIAAAVARQWRIAGFLVFALAVESASYRTTTLVVHRHRPTVHRLEHLPVNASYPSGHTAAAIAVYCGIALLVTSRVRSLAWRIAIWAVAAAIPVYVALSRMYRGMHHPLDVLGGVVIGVCAVVALVFVCRAAGAAAERRGAASRA